MTSTAPDDNEESLQKIFQAGLDLYNNLGRIDEPTNSPAVQVFKLLILNHESLWCNKFHFMIVMLNKNTSFLISAGVF